MMSTMMVDVSARPVIEEGRKNCPKFIIRRRRTANFLRYVDSESEKNELALTEKRCDINRSTC